MSSSQHKKSNRSTMDVVNCTGASLRRATRMVTQAYDSALRPVQLRVTQFSLIATLAKMGDTPMTQLAETLLMDRTTLTRNLKPLIDREYICIVFEEDQRIRVVSLTKLGHAKFNDALPYWRETQSKMVKKLGRKRWSAMLDDLMAAIDAVHDE